MDETKKQYEELKNRFGLPEYEVLDQEFDLTMIDEDHLTLKHIRDKIIEKIEHFSKVLEQLIQPDANVAAMNEVKFLDDESKDIIYELFRKFMRATRAALKLDIHKDDSEEARMINDLHTLWQESKPNLTRISDLLISSWDKESEVRENLGYVG